MKAEIKRDGFVHITAETPAEAFAIKHLFKHDGRMIQKTEIEPPPIVVNCEILNESQGES